MKILNRAKSIHSDYYAIGEWFECEGRCFIIETDNPMGFEVNSHHETFDDGMLDGEMTIQDFIYEVEKDTRALNFEDMIDSEGNKIFASLSKDGKGGDRLVGPNLMTNKFKLMIKKNGTFNIAIGGPDGFKWKDLRVVGIQK